MNYNKKISVYIVLIALGLLFGPTHGLADSVKTKLGERSCVVGESLFFGVSISLKEEKQIDVSKVVFNGVPLRYEVSNQGTSSFTMSVNGKTIRKSSGQTKTYIFELPTSEVGPIVLPEYPILVGGKEYTTSEIHFEVLPKPTSDKLLFVTTVLNQRELYYPTQIVEVDCKIYYRDFPGSPSIVGITLPILNHSGFELIPPRNPDLKLLINGAEFPVSTTRGNQQRNGNMYHFFGFVLKFRLMNAGEFSFNNSIKMQVETGRTRRERSFFGSQLVKETKIIFGDSPTLAIAVQELPQDNVPATFNGAIGDFRIKVIPSSDTGIKVGFGNCFLVVAI